MSVWLLKEYWGDESGDGEDLHGIFSSWEKAMECYYKKLEAGGIQDYHSVELVEVEVDTNKSLSWETIQRGE